ncbi:MAG: AAA family ATPase [Saprospiraceae bacterium]|nr:AAA family ATPase [Saprospiraceae bacterium]MCF8249995.1 AAA family ATPase [Saprospiraceae bacterium]MCF8278965.1 AAA family ATPase [Bacteroidales bacterium]MCF8311008.1 AAA family ATPase [Saprospiraceae bacterium]MCF8439656.1 AAA family ATPase [Saprospiraceae bacterium]
MEPFRITSLEAHQIGPFGDLKMTFPEKPAGMADKAEVHILTGENGVGKSTVLELLASSFIYGKVDSSILKIRNKVKHNFFEVKFSEGQSSAKHYYHDEVNYDQDNEFLHNNYWHLIRLPTAPYAIAAFSYSGYRKVEQSYIEGIKELNTQPFENVLDFRSSINPSHILQWIANNIAKEAIFDRNLDSKGTNRYSKALINVETAISKIINKAVEFDLESEPFQVIISVDNEKLNFNQLPDGLKSIISWLADLLMRMDRVKWVDDIPVFERNFILFLDEIEVHMHPRWQRKILPAVQGLFPNAQIFISTHSPFVINSVDGAWIHRLVKPNGDSQALEPVLSEDGKSISMVLDEIFGVSEQFGEAVERDLKVFYELRNSIIKGETNGKEQAELLGLAKKLQGQSTTLDQIVAMEIRQLNRVKNLTLAI